MASLTEVYSGGSGAGAVLVTAGLVVASTGIGSYLGLGLYRSRELAGILGGLGFPAVLLGTMVALPRASRGLQTAAVVGAGICLLGVGLFARWYPVDWIGGSGNSTMTLVVAFTYFAGTILTSWSLFTAVANFKARNDPGGTISLEITKAGETRVVEVSNDELRGKLGGIGTLGGTPDGEAQTQTNRGSGSGRERSTSTPSNPLGDASATDGGATATRSIHEPTGTDGTDDAELVDDAPRQPSNDRYCGNCSHFRYARTDDGLVPYCGLHSEAMEDMDACEQWSPNTT